MDDFAATAFRERRARQTIRRRGLLIHAAVWAAVNVFLVVVWLVTGRGTPWFLYVVFGWGIGLVAHGAATYFVTDPDDVLLAEEEDRLRSRAATRQDPI